MSSIARKLVAEALATFLFVFAIIGAVNNAGVLAPLAIGFALMVLVYATGHISGAHLNPAVSFGVWLRGGISAVEFGGYVVAQLIGAVLAALVGFAVFPAPEAAAQFTSVSGAFIAEAIFTFILVWVVLNTATSKDTDGNSFYGLAIGATVFVGAATVGAISGGGFNPAVALGLSVSGQFAWGNLWLYVLAPLVGAALAAAAFKLLSANDFELAQPVKANAKASAQKK